MNRKRLVRTVLSSGALCSLVAPIAALACTPSYVVQLTVDEDTPPPDYSAECKLAWDNREAILRDLRSGARDFMEFRTVAYAFRDGSAGCEERPHFAFEMANANIRSPLQPNEVLSSLSEFYAWAPADLPAERFEEVAVGYWALRAASRGGFGMCGSGPYFYRDYTPENVSTERLRAILVEDYYWTPSVEQFGNNPGRDRLILRELIDPQSPRSDLNLAKELAPQFGVGDRFLWDMRILVDVAEAITDPRGAQPDYEAAAIILDWFSPFSQNRLDDDESERTQALWVRIAQSRLSSADLRLKRTAEMILRSGDPSARAGVPFSEILPEGAELIELESWPVGLPPLRNPDRWASRIAENYPSRALREGISGRVELGMLFGPDGVFQSLHVTRSAGDILDSAAVRGYLRYMRPRGSEMTLSGYGGRYVYVPLPAVEYHLEWFSSNRDQSGLNDDGTTIVSQGARFRQ